LSTDNSVEVGTINIFVDWWCRCNV